MKNISLLDCTIRDGGYYTNWNFNSNMVKDLINSLNDSNVDVIELGYKSPLKGGKFRKCNDRFIWEILEYRLPTKSKLAFMIDAKDFIKNNKIDYDLINDVIHEKQDSPFSICRIAIKHSEIESGYNIAKYIQTKGYDIIVNLMGITLLSDTEIKDFNKFSELNPTALYFADSYGNLEPNRTSEVVHIFKEFGCKVGIHTHDNLGLAFANCLSALNSDVDWIDGTLLGMGRGVGNVKTEQLITYFQYKLNLYNSSPLHEILSNWMIPLHKKYKWGFTHNYMISGIKNIHPTYPQILQSSFLNPNIIEGILLDIDNSTSYDYSKIEEKLKPKVAVVIPARYKSSRFPGKPLAKIKGKEMIIWVAEIAEKAVGIENVFIATENEEIVDVVKEYGYKVVLTSDSCLTGTDRVAEASLEIDADIIINIQGDEPLLNPSDIQKVIDCKIQHPTHIINCMSYLNKHEKVEDKKIPKVVTNLHDELIYISRNPIPGTKFGNGNNPKKQVCIYAFNREHLSTFIQYGQKTPLEFQEDIEVLRFIEMGYKVKMVTLDNESYAVDYPEDIDVVESILNK
jgi:3-deoxy-manno-octulosonate cytidylyltransferase (CMP-KDO synthetase)